MAAAPNRCSSHFYAPVRAGRFYWRDAACVCCRDRDWQINRQGLTHPTLSFRAGPIRMGRAKNLPVGGKGAGVRRQCRCPLPPARGRSSLPLEGAGEPPVGVRMTHVGRGKNTLKKKKTAAGGRLSKRKAEYRRGLAASRTTGIPRLGRLYAGRYRMTNCARTHGRAGQPRGDIPDMPVGEGRTNAFPFRRRTRFSHRPGAMGPR